MIVLSVLIDLLESRVFGLTLCISSILIKKMWPQKEEPETDNLLIRSRILYLYLAVSDLVHFDPASVFGTSREKEMKLRMGKCFC